MARVEDSTIIFDSKEEMVSVKKLCSECSLNLVCGGVDEKINGAAVNDSISFKATDKKIKEQASCLKKK